MTTALADTDDLRDVLGYQPDDLIRANRLIEFASAAVERWCGREFSYVEDEERTIEVTTGVLRLPHPPVLSVASIRNPDGDEVTADRYTVARDGLVTLGTYGHWPAGAYSVVYTHGFETIPDDVVEVVCALVEARLTGSTVYASESLGDWSGTYREHPATGDAAEPILRRLVHYRRNAGRIVTL